MRVRSGVAVVVVAAACASPVVELEPGPPGGDRADAGPPGVDAGPVLGDAGPLGADASLTEDAEVRDPATSVFDPTAELAAPIVVPVFAPTNGGPVMQGGDFRLVFTGSTYLVFWVENRGGLRAVVQRAGPTTGPKRPLISDTQTTVDGAMEGRPQALAEADGRVALAWTTRRAVVMAWTDREGVLLEGPVTVRTFTELNGGYLARLHPDPDGGYVFFGSSYADRDGALRVTRVDARGGLRAFTTAPGAVDTEPYDLGDVVPTANGGWMASWHTRRPGPNSPNEVLTSALDRDLRVTAQRVHVTEEDAWSGALWPVGAPRYMAARVYGEGYRLRALDGSIERRVPARVWSQQVPEDGGERIGLLVQTGTAQGGLPSGLAYQAWDPASDTLSDPVVLQPDDGRCLERAEGVAAGDRVGVAWVMGCPARILYFAELRVR